jgi:hypothetical protein
MFLEFYGRGAAPRLVWEPAIQEVYCVSVCSGCFFVINLFQ